MCRARQEIRTAIFTCRRRRVSYTIYMSFLTNRRLVSSQVWSVRVAYQVLTTEYINWLSFSSRSYTIRNVSRCWTYETSVALGVEIANELPYNDYFEYFGPDFKLHISPSNMSNQNTPEYLEKIKNRLFENLRMLPHAPGVQVSFDAHCINFWFFLKLRILNRHGMQINNVFFIRWSNKYLFFFN